MQRAGIVFQELEENWGKEEKLRKELEGTNAKLIAEKNELFLKLEGEKGSLSESEGAIQKLTAHKADLEKQIAVSDCSDLCRRSYPFHSGCQ